MSASADWLATKDYADVALTILVEGLDLGYTTSDDASGLSAAWATVSEFATVRSGLQIAGTVSQEVNIFDAQIQPSSLTFTVVDQDDTLIKALFGTARTDITRVDLATSIDSDDIVGSGTQSLDGVFGGGVGTAGTVYLGNETISAINVGSAFSATQRGFRSLAGTSTDPEHFGRPHAVDPVTGDKPIISSLPISFVNRTIGLYLSHRVNGVWSAGLPESNANDSHLLWMGRIKSWSENGSGSVSLSCVEITERLQTTLLTKQYQGSLDDGIVLTQNDIEIGTSLSTFNTSDGSTIAYPPGFIVAYSTWGTAGDKVRAPQIVSQINAVLQDRFVTHAGTYGPTTYRVFMGGVQDDGHYNVSLQALTGTLAGFQSTLDLYLAPRIWKFLGWGDVSSNFNTNTTINSVVQGLTVFSADLTLEQDGVKVSAAPNNPQHRFILPSDIPEANGGVFVDVIPDDGQQSFTPFFGQPVVNVPPSAPGGLFTLSRGYLLLNEKHIVQVTQTSDNPNRFQINTDVTSMFLSQADKTTATTSQTEITTASKVTVKQVWLETGTMGQIMLRLMASTGTAGYNHPDHDVYPPWMSVGVPWSLLDSTSVLNLDQTQYCLFLQKPTPFPKLLESALNFAGKQCVFGDGRISTISTTSGAVGSADLIALTEDNKAKQVSGARDQVQERTTCDVNLTGIINRLTLKYNQTLGGSFDRVITVNATASQTNYEQAKGAVIEAPGIYDVDGPFGVGGDIDPGIHSSLDTWTQYVTSTALAYFSEPIATINRSFDFSLAAKMIPGARVSITDSALIDPTTGLRGVRNLLGWVIGYQFDWTTGVGKVTCVFQPNRASDRFTLWAPSARVDISGAHPLTPSLTVMDHNGGITGTSITGVGGTKTPTSDAVQIVAVTFAKSNIGPTASVSMSGLGLTWGPPKHLSVNTVNAGSLGTQGLAVFAAQGTATPGNVTATFSLSQSRTILTWFEVVGGDVTTLSVAGTFFDHGPSQTIGPLSCSGATSDVGMVFGQSATTTPAMTPTSGHSVIQVVGDGVNISQASWKLLPDTVGTFSATLVPNTIGNPNLAYLKMSAGSAGGGYDAPTKTLTLLPHQYSLSSEPRDIESFSVGDPIHVVQLSPDNPVAPLEWFDVIAGISVSTNKITLTTGLNSPVFSGTKNYVVEYNRIAVATPTQKGFHAFLADPTTKSTGNAPNDAYFWGGEATPVDATYVYQQRYERANFTEDDTGTPASVHKMGELSDWVNTALVYHTAPVYANQLFAPSPIDVETTQFQTVCGPLFIPLYFGSNRRLIMRALIKQELGTAATMRFVSSVSRPAGPAIQGFFDPTYVDVAAGGTNWGTVSRFQVVDYEWVEAIVSPRVTTKDGVPGCYVTVDVANSDSKMTTHIYGWYVAEEQAP